MNAKFWDDNLVDGSTLISIKVYFFAYKLNEPDINEGTLRGDEKLFECDRAGSIEGKKEVNTLALRRPKWHLEFSADISVVRYIL